MVRPKAPACRHGPFWPNPELPVPNSQRGVAILARSGAFLVKVCNAERALPIVFAASIGNQAVVDVADFMDMLVGHAHIVAIGLYLESVGNAKSLARSAHAAAMKDIPIVVLKSGSTPEGQVAAARVLEQPSVEEASNLRLRCLRI